MTPPTFRVSDPSELGNQLNPVSTKPGQFQFALITQRAIRRGSFTSVPQLVAKIDQFVQHYNRHARPFLWTATADSILGKIERLCTVINGTGH